MLTQDMHQTRRRTRQGSRGKGGGGGGMHMDLVVALRIEQTTDWQEEGMTITRPVRTAGCMLSTLKCLKCVQTRTPELVCAATRQQIVCR